MAGTIQNLFNQYKKKYPLYTREAIVNLMVNNGVITPDVAKKINSGVSLFGLDDLLTENKPQEIDMTDIMGGCFNSKKAVLANSKVSKVQSNINTQNNPKKEITTHIDDFINFFNKNNVFFTKNLSGIIKMIDENISKENVVEFLLQFNKKNKKSFFDMIADYKFVNDKTRMDILLSIVEKLEGTSNAKGQDLFFIISKLKENIRYEFRSVGLVSKDNINALFNVVLNSLQKTKTTVLSQKASDLNNEFEIDTATKYQFKEKIEKSGNKIYGKTCTYKLSDGKQLVEYYVYNSNLKKFYLEQKRWYDKDNNILKLAGYYLNEPQTISSVHYYKNGMQIESNHFRPDETQAYKIMSDGVNYKEITYSLDGKCVCIRTIDNVSDDSKRKEKSLYYNTNGYEISDIKNKKRFSLEDYYSIEKEQLSDFFKSKFLNRIRVLGLAYNKDIACDVIETIAHKAIELGCERNIDTSDLNVQLSSQLNKKDIFRASAVLKQMLARVTKGYSIIEHKDYNNELSFDNKYEEFSQGHFGTCWLTAAVKALSLTEDGKRLLESAVVKYNEEINKITVTLKGTPIGTKTYVYTKEQVEQASELSTGNGRERAIEVAFRDLFLECDKKELKHSNDIEGGSTGTAFRIITGVKARTYNAYSKDASKQINKAIEDIKTMGKISCVCSFKKVFYSTIPYEKDNSISSLSEQIITFHAYVLKGIDENFAYLINPWNTAKVIKIDLNDFKKYCETLSIAQFNNL